MAPLKETVLSVLEGYTGRALNGYSYLTTGEDETVFAVVSIGEVRGKRIVDSGLVVRVVGDKVIIERDVNDKLLVDALLQAGVPRTQIVLAYSGEADSVVLLPH